MIQDRSQSDTVTTSFVNEMACPALKQSSSFFCAPAGSSLWLSPAKLNLMLRINQERPDGYHNLQSLVCLIDWYDQIYLRVCDKGRIRRTSDNRYCNACEDLSVRAAKLLSNYTSCALGVDIYIKKNIPVQAGLGGGSSNAATCLQALNQLWKLGLSLQELIELASQLGSDVASFLPGTSAWVEGRGDLIYPLVLNSAAYTIIVPHFQIATPSVYSTLRNRFPISGRAQSKIRLKDFLCGASINDLNEPAAVTEPNLGVLQNAIAQKGFNVRLTGSGSALYLEGHRAQELRAAISSQKYQMPFLYQASSLKRHVFVAKDRLD